MGPFVSFNKYIFKDLGYVLENFKGKKKCVDTGLQIVIFLES